MGPKVGTLSKTFMVLSFVCLLVVNQLCPSMDNVPFSKNTYQVENSSIYGLAGSKINMINTSKTIGEIRYVKLPFCNWYVLYAFFIAPLYRRCGNGHNLFNHVVSILKNEGATRLIIQPGPFEYINNQCISPWG